MFGEIVRLESAEVFTDDTKVIIKQSELMFSDKVAPGYFHSASNAAPTPPPIRKSIGMTILRPAEIRHL